MTEEWRAIDGYPDYQVSNEGRVRRTTLRTCGRIGHILRPGLRSGYPSVDFCCRGKRRSHLVHHLVAAAFLGPCPDGHEVNHVNGDKTQNQAANLEYTTRSSNQLHAYRMGLQDARGEKNGHAKLTRELVIEIRAFAAQPNRPSYPHIAKMFNVSESNIRAIVTGRTWKDAL
jgi:hypothetical protein